MNLVKPYARILNINKYGEDYSTNPFSSEDGQALLRKIEWCGRISHRSEDVMDSQSSLVSKEVDFERTKRFITAVVMGHGDWSIVEHASVSVDMLVDRGITHELVRHRLFSYTQESTRFVNYEKKMPPQFIQPLELKFEQDIQIWKDAINNAEYTYINLMQAGVKPQIARSVFPNALASRIITTGNLRNWRHFFIMRTTKEAHPQMREVSIPLLNDFKRCIPLLYDDIFPESRQADNMRLPR